MQVDLVPIAKQNQMFLTSGFGTMRTSHQGLEQLIKLT